MPSKYMVHPMEQKFHDDMIEQAKRNAYIKDIFDECEELGITDAKMMFRRAFIMGQHYESLKRTVNPNRTYDEWLQTKVGEIDGGEMRVHHFLGPDQHQVGRYVYDTLMKELAK